MLAENYVKTVWRDEIEKYVLTPSGADMIAMFEDKLLPSVKSSLKHSVDQYYKNESSRKSLRCDVRPVGDNVFNVELELKEGKNSLLALSLMAGSKQRALTMCRTFRRDPYAVYKQLSELLDQPEE